MTTESTPSSSWQRSELFLTSTLSPCLLSSVSSYQPSLLKVTSCGNISRMSCVLAAQIYRCILKGKTSDVFLSKHHTRPDLLCVSRTVSTLWVSRSAHGLRVPETLRSLRSKEAKAKALLLQREAVDLLPSPTSLLMFSLPMASVLVSPLGSSFSLPPSPLSCVDSFK